MVEAWIFAPERKIQKMELKFTDGELSPTSFLKLVELLGLQGANKIASLARLMEEGVSDDR